MKRPTKYSDTGVILFGHGSRIKEANKTLLEVAKTICSRCHYDLLQPAFLEFESPNIQEAIDLVVNQGKRKIIIHPYFLYMGSHVKKELPDEIEIAKARYPSLDIILAGNLGYHEKIVDVAIERINNAFKEIADSLDKEPSNDKVEGEAFVPHPIEAESFRIISKKLDETRFSNLEISVVKRVIHATADYDFETNLLFSKNAVKSGIESISNGADIITDVRMVEAGINRSLLKHFGGKVICYSRDSDIVTAAEKEGTTRAAAAMKKACDSLKGNIVVIGNAPTALMEIVRLIKIRQAVPSLVAGVPVGFVGAAESKEELILTPTEYITCRGVKGGSGVAVAIINALMILASEDGEA